MAETCKMTLTQQAVDRVGPLQIAIFAPPEYCVDPERQADTGPFNGEARITNLGQSPVSITHANGNVAFRAFRSTAVWEAAHPSGATRYAEPPLAPSEITRATVSLAPGQSLVLKSWSRHQDAIESAVLSDPAQASRSFVVEYQYNFEANGQAVSGSNQTKTTARLLK